MIFDPIDHRSLEHLPAEERLMLQESLRELAGPRVLHPHFRTHLGMLLVASTLPETVMQPVQALRRLNVAGLFYGIFSEEVQLCAAGVKYLAAPPSELRLKTEHTAHDGVVFRVEAAVHFTFEKSELQMHRFFLRLRAPGYQKETTDTFLFEIHRSGLTYVVNTTEPGNRLNGVQMRCAFQDGAMEREDTSLSIPEPGYHA